MLLIPIPVSSYLSYLRFIRGFHGIPIFFFITTRERSWILKEQMQPLSHALEYWIQLFGVALYGDQVAKIGFTKKKVVLGLLNCSQGLANSQVIPHPFHDLFFRGDSPG